MKKIIRKITILLLAVLMILSTLGFSGCVGSENDRDAYITDDNYRTFYQIFVGSFSDSNNDGIGDIRGIIERFDYLNDGNPGSEESLGVEGIWLSPIFSSPSYHKYDATNYYQIDWRFGSEDDLKELIELCNERNVKLILDLAINHTSTQHEWFVKFKEARISGDTESEYYDYYSAVTTAEKVGGITYQKIAGVDCWYECNFSGNMPELNFDNQAVRERTLEIAKYYLDLGVHGFRFDAIKYIYYGDTAKSVEFWEWYMEELRAYCPEIYCVGECWSGESEILEYYGAMNCFNFGMSQAEGTIATAAKGNSNILNFTKYVESYQKKVLAKDQDAMIMPFLSNHDMDRIAGAFVTENNMKMAANLYLLCSGSPVIYYGEEIGMRGSRGSANTDANRRLAMLWGDDDLVRDPVGSTYPANKQISTTVKDQSEDENSLLNYYRELISIRHRYPAIARGMYTSLDCKEKNLGGFIIEHEETVIVLLHNTSAIDTLSVDLASLAALDGVELSKIGDYIGQGKATLKGTVLTLEPQTSVIIK